MWKTTWTLNFYTKGVLSLLWCCFFFFFKGISQSLSPFPAGPLWVWSLGIPLTSKYRNSLTRWKCSLYLHNSMKCFLTRAQCQNNAAVAFVRLNHLFPAPDGSNASKEVCGGVLPISQSHSHKRSRQANDLQEAICHQPAPEEAS